MSYIFTSEYVSYGHPDKIADQIADLILDYYIANYECPKVAIEVLIARNKIVVAGEVSEEIDTIKLTKLLHDWIEEFNCLPYLELKDLEIIFLIDKQSKDIACLVKDCGAGDQGIMYGYANCDTESFMPAPVHYARKILNEIMNKTKFGPDAKSQIAIEYKDNKPIKIKKILVSIQHPQEIDYRHVKQSVLPFILKSLLPYECDESDIMVNPAGQFIMGGPQADTGLTGRKIIVDTYGAFAPHGGGAFSGKDPTKVDRSAAYMARYLAKNIVAAGLAKEAIVQLAYTIGISQPFSFSINTKGTGIMNDYDLARLITDLIDLSPQAIITRLKLWRPIYCKTARDGHFGNTYCSWEELSFVNELKILV